jgi:hypothetical protein
MSHPQHPPAPQAPPPYLPSAQGQPYGAAPHQAQPYQGVPQQPPAPYQGVPQQPYQPPAPYQGEPQQPYQPPAPYQGVPQQQVGYGVPAGVVCRICGNGPALKATARAHRGMLVMMQFRSIPGPFCRSCGIAAVRRMTADSLVQGWWSPASLVIFTPAILLINLITRLRLAGLDEPRPMHPNAVYPMDPGDPIYLRWQILGLLVPVIPLIIIAVGAIASS